jgi:hypothetical protein
VDPFYVADTTNFIQPEGHVNGLELTGGRMLVVRDYDGGYSPTIPITIDQYLATDATGVLRMEFEADDWGSTISFQSGIPVTLGGALELAFASGTSLSNQIGRTFDVFDWTGVSPTGAFGVNSPFVWDVSKLYTAGEVTFLAAAGIPGDFNNDNSVNAADFVLWRKGVGTIYTQAAYDVWRSHFGQVFTGGSGSRADTHAAVPEPAVLTLVLAVLLMTPCWSRRARGFAY